MKYLLVNASPRGKKSNSWKILEQIEQGIKKSNTIQDEDISIITLRLHLKKKTWQTYIEQADNIIIAFPLYADHVPGIVKQWLEEVGPNGLKNKKLGWIAQCGFPESIHLEFVEKYCYRVTELLGADSLGVIKKPGAEGIRLMPPKMNQKLFSALQDLGYSIIYKNQFDSNLIKELEKPRKYNFISRFIFRVLSFLGITNIYWNMNLKKNLVFKERFARPYSA